MGLFPGKATASPDEMEVWSRMLKELVDNEDQVSKWLVHGNMDCKSLAKMLPVTTQDLIDRKTTADDVIDAPYTIDICRYCSVTTWFVN